MHAASRARGLGVVDSDANRTRPQGVLVTTLVTTLAASLAGASTRQCSMTCGCASAFAVALSGPGCGTKTAWR